jgi:hypothetical protein
MAEGLICDREEDAVRQTNTTAKLSDLTIPYFRSGSVGSKNIFMAIGPSKTTLID